MVRDETKPLYERLSDCSMIRERNGSARKNLPSKLRVTLFRNHYSTNSYLVVGVSGTGGVSTVQNCCIILAIDVSS